MLESSIIYAGQAVEGQMYLAGTNKDIVVKYLGKGVAYKKEVCRLLNVALDSEVNVAVGYLLKVLPAKEAEERMAKKTNGKTATPKVAKKLKVCIDYAKLERFFADGMPVTIKEILEKVDVEKTTCAPSFRVYATLEKQMRKGILKKVGRGTFQLAGSNKKAPPPPATEPAKKAPSKPKGKAKAKAKAKPSKPAEKAVEKPASEAPAPAGDSAENL